MQRKKRRNQTIFATEFAVCMGVLAGCILFLVSVLHFHQPVGEYNIESLGVLVADEDSKLRFSAYILRKRVLQWGCFFAGWCAFSYYVTAGIYHLTVGAYYGFFSCVLFVQFGLWGSIYSVLCFAPQYVLMFAAIRLMGNWFAEAPSTTGQYYNNVNKLQYFLKICAIFLCMAGALLWELQFQKNILNYFYQYLV